MSKAFKAMWLGDSDPSAQMVTIGDLSFVKGESVSVPADFAYADAITGNPTFAVDDAKADPVEADEPEAVDPDEGTEKGAIKARLRAMGVTVQGNPSLDTLRGKLADATK